jgi:hypothetical protein
MVRHTQFRKVLPLLHTPIAIAFGGWGLWIRNSILSRPFWGGSTGWQTTEAFHVWPWPFKFAAILNMPAFFIGSLLSLPLEYLHVRPWWVSVLPVILLVPALWYLVGAWLDERQLRIAKMRIPRYVPWVSIFLHAAVSLVGALISLRFLGLYTGFIPYGIVVWAGLGTAIAVFKRW